MRRGGKAPPADPGGWRAGEWALALAGLAGGACGLMVVAVKRWKLSRRGEDLPAPELAAGVCALCKRASCLHRIS